jgi:glycosyltransferase involved in cell wall biosynthesis
MVEPRVTVLMPVYNAERYLQDAVDSVLNQSFKDFEFLIIDDGSTDSTPDIINSYEDSRIRFLRNEKNFGISHTLNKGIALASCDLIARMDGDDISLPDRLMKQFTFMATNPRCAMVSSWAEVVTANDEFVRLEKYRSEFYYYNLTFECWIYHPTVMFRKQCVEAVGGYSMMYSEDYDLFWKISTRYPIANLSEALVKYRLSPTSLNSVLKKQEYEHANETNVLRSIRFYMGDDFKVSKAVLECLRHNFNPIIESGNIQEATNALQVLDQITEKIIERPNPNRNVEAIKEANHYKRKFILTQLARHLPVTKGLALLSQLGEWMKLYSLSVDYVRWQVKKVKTFLMM